MTDKPGVEQFLTKKVPDRRNFFRLAGPRVAASVLAFLTACGDGKEVTPTPIPIPTAIVRPTSTPLIEKPTISNNPIDVIKDVNEHNPSIVEIHITQPDGTIATTQVANMHPIDRTKTINPELVTTIDGLVRKMVPPETDMRYASGERIVIMWDVLGGDMFKGKNPILPEMGTYALTVTFDNNGKGYHATFIPVDYLSPSSPDLIETVATEWCQGSTGVALPNQEQTIQDEKTCNEFGLAARFASEGAKYEMYGTFVNQHPLQLPGLPEIKMKPYSAEKYGEMVDALRGVVPMVQIP
ncbi:hypothetical protein COU89_01665 [Candidatus Roizmanbacteria bacterium CG10_big_fil_rev_8_21_14_0_10_45_7]|uniref:Uncharacterized protein n=1 Tax=Candidatus Roizmanbacteria bacterium CG10_big_fil_rev_8_21_14_0_10_45_7 TaxID=1974854 RepID=A0A2M8KV14_9BACT|nr:MAG: hypothetical protein COU89_01665 [Candidatus Roizmanbacteria bacterium CG10_big_fil_rev_8_21_14_0_10_45_7]